MSKVNENRDWRIYQDNNHLDIHIKNNISIIDSTLIDLCLNLYPLGKFRKAKGTIKAHVKINVTTSIPDFIHITDRKVHDTYVLDPTPIVVESFYTFNKGYLDYGRL